MACTLHTFSDIASNTMALIKELRSLAAAGKCGRTATSYRLVTSDKSVRLTVYETIIIMDVYCLCTILKSMLLLVA